MFPSRIWIEDTELDNERLKDKIYAFEKEVKSEYISNQGGYQGHGFYDSDFIHTLCKYLPLERKVDIIPQTWVNINKKGDYNARHTHTCTDVFLCGTYYASAPKDCGGIRFWDPRGAYMSSMPDLSLIHI